jgi:adenylate cyclase
MSNGSHTHDRKVQTVTVLCTDLRAFSEFYGNLKPMELADLMNTHYEDAVEIVAGEGGHVDKFMGDSIMAFFDSANAESRAVSAGVKLKAKVAERWSDLPMSIGIATGEAVIGHFGPASHRVHTLFGDCCTRAVRLERRSHITGFKILVDEHTKARLGKQVHVDEHPTHGSAALQETKVYEIGLHAHV